MPESPDIDTDKLREAVQEELGREGGGFLRRIALTTAVLAAVAAIAALKAGSTANGALFQVAIALGALAALTRSRAVWLASLSLGAVGFAFFAAQFLS